MNILAFSCTHAPFVHEHALDFLRDLKRKYKPDTIVCLGDLGDWHGFSRKWRKNPNTPSQKEERRQCLAFCHQLYKLFPKVSACEGNHDGRLSVKLTDADTPEDLIPGIRDIYESPVGWDWRKHHVIDSIGFIHGHQPAPGGGVPALRFMRIVKRSVAIGHFHTEGGVRRENTDFGNHFGLSVGCLIDPDTYAMKYAEDRLIKPVPGAGIVIDGVPSFEELRG